MADDDTPRFRIQAVSELTGIPAPSLRAWERRYGVPTPGRTGKGYRLYSQRDVDMLGRMRDLCEAGVSASDAARMVGQAPVGQAPVGGSPAGEQLPRSPPSGPHAAVAARIVAAVERYDVDALERELHLAQSMGSAPLIFEEIFAPAMREIGDGWHQGRLSISQEHLASEVLARASRSLLDLVQPGSAPKTALLACWDEEQHVLPLYGIAFRLAQWGYRCIVLGARTPPEALAEAVEGLRPALVGLSLTVTPPPAVVSPQLAAYAQAVGRCRWVVGGQGAAGIRARLQAAGAMVHDGDDEALRRALAAPRAGT